ncbi:hypothetical protein [Staphylococcus hyicus]|uniref:hypothetical protein n=1 Tax=Staphylococcus hyicus TaxID=1284 RepID=UPI00208E6B67|nr:hypothetical protein [Staphylococcus hyicus]MCO4331306.1 hypothetical protein [Staphylococcus hyicus]MCO4334030.1 hypothetical protein [Staphylococcus hyicus]UWF55698.1 hypothetical protein NZD48_06450 [Staphylococcus hyicus]
MKKVGFIFIASSIFLASCGSQNLLPLEQKSTKLSDENHDLKLENQELKSEISKKQQKLKALNKDNQNKGQAQKNQTMSNYLNVSSEYYKELTQLINDYNKIDSDILKNKKNNDISDQLDAIISDHDDAVKTYEDGLDDKALKKDKEMKKQDDALKKLQKQIKSAFSKIKSGYDHKDENKISEGRQTLTQLEVNVKSPENQ